MHRVYRYTINLKGQLFCAGQTRPLRDAAFLDFFFKRLERNADPDSSQEYPWLSRCGRELNLIKCADRPIVLRALDGGEFTFAGTLVEPFAPEHLCISESLGRLYYNAQQLPARRANPCLIASNVAFELSKCILEHREAIAPFQFEFKGHLFPIQSIT
jgi:hypothetical protein